MEYFDLERSSLAEQVLFIYKKGYCIPSLDIFFNYPYGIKYMTVLVLHCLLEGC